ncbi:MAG: lytic transglycosylase domain-containing protein [Myxococcota bacterium]
MAKRRPVDPWHLKRHYDAVAWPLLAVTLAVAALGFGLRLLAGGLAGLLGTELPTVWQRLAEITGIDDAWLRFTLFAALHAAVIAALWHPVARAWAASRPKPAKRVRRARAPAPRAPVRGPAPSPAGRGAGVATTAAAPARWWRCCCNPRWCPCGSTAPPGWPARPTWSTTPPRPGWSTRPPGSSNAVIARPRRPVGGVSADAFDADLDADAVPLIDPTGTRCCSTRATATAVLAARTKAFMWVESGGRQFAVSATGCSGLMQFCASTAQRAPFHHIFGVGQVSACGCRDCGVPREVQVALETDPEAVRTHADRFPCPLTDARFDAERSIRAGVAFVRELGADVGDNLPLMYVGYNAGPAVSRGLYRQLGRRGDLSIAEIAPHLEPALRPYYGDRAAGRARGLVGVHLPKLVAAYERWK